MDVDASILDPSNGRRCVHSGSVKWTSMRPFWICQMDVDASILDPSNGRRCVHSGFVKWTSMRPFWIRQMDVDASILDPSKGRRCIHSGCTFGWLCYVQSTARSFRDGTPFTVPCEGREAPFQAETEPRAVVWQSITLNDALLFQNKENKTRFGPPPPKKKRLKDTNGRDMSTRTSVCLYMQPVYWIFTRSRFSRLSDSDYRVTPSLKINIFFQAHISAFMIFLYVRTHVYTKLQRKGHSLKLCCTNIALCAT